MKRNIIAIAIPTSLILILLVFGGLIFVIANNYEKEDMGLDLRDSFFDTTYEFYGTSEHFKFNIGQVYFSSEEQKILIQDFQQTSAIKDLATETLTVMFDNKEWIKLEKNKNMNVLNETIEEFWFYEGGIICTEDSGMLCEKTVFDLSNKENFKQIIKIELEYCLKSGQCSQEVFEIHYTK